MWKSVLSLENDILNSMTCNLLKRFAAMLLLVAPGALADLQARGFWTRASLPGANTAAIYGELVNTGEDSVVIAGIETTVARRAEIHRSAMKDGMMSMSAIRMLSLDGGGRVSFEPGGLHIMLMGLKEPLRQGTVFGVSLTLGDGSTLNSEVEVGAIDQLETPGD